jgi:hypothetical protein
MQTNTAPSLSSTIGKRLAKRICHGCGEPKSGLEFTSEKHFTCRACRKKAWTGNLGCANAAKIALGTLQSSNLAPVAVQPANAPSAKIEGLAAIVAEEVSNQIGAAVAAYFARLGVK